MSYTERAWSQRFHRLRVDGRPKRIKNFAFTSVCVYNRLRVDRALPVLPLLAIIQVINTLEQLS